MLQNVFTSQSNNVNQKSTILPNYLRLIFMSHKRLIYTKKYQTCDGGGAYRHDSTLSRDRSLYIPHTSNGSQILVVGGRCRTSFHRVLLPETLCTQRIWTSTTRLLEGMLFKKQQIF